MHKEEKIYEVSCLNCHSTCYKSFANENGYSYVKCCNCGLIYLNPRPPIEDVISFQKGEKAKGKKVINVTGRYKKEKVKRYIKILGDFFEKDELGNKNLEWLDIGCGFCEFMIALLRYSDYNLKVTGTELNERKIDFCRKKRLDVKIIELNKHKHKYNYISLLNVFSHLPDPVKFIDKLKRNFKPGGELFIETGHVSHIPARYFPKPFYAPDHLSFANKEIIEDILDRSGYEVVNEKIYRGESYPEITDIKKILKQTVKIIFKYKDGRISNFFPKYPNIDLFVRARVKNEK